MEIGKGTGSMRGESICEKSLHQVCIEARWPFEHVTCRSDLKATKGKGLARVMAEAAWRRLYEEQKLPIHTFRLGGERAQQCNPPCSISKS